MGTKSIKRFQGKKRVLRYHPDREHHFHLHRHRPQLSEGMNFNDAKARCVVAVGVPYPSAVDPLVTNKKRCDALLGRLRV